MAQNIYYHSQNEESEHSEEALHQSKVKTQQDKPSNPGVPCLMSKDLHGFAACKMDLSAQGGFQFLYDVLLGRYPMALAHLTSCGHQCNPDFTSTYLGPVALLNCGGRFHNPFSCVSFMTLKPELDG